MSEKVKRPTKAATAAATALSKLGARKGGTARANVLTKSERSDIAKRAAAARWHKPDEDSPGADLTEATAARTRHRQPAPRAERTPFSLFPGTLTIGDVSFECHVLNDHRRVLTQREVVRVVSGGRDSGNLARYLQRLPSFDHDLSDRTIQFQIPGPRGGANTAIGYEATLLIEICDAYLRARDLDLLRPNQEHLARMAEIVVRACAKVGIIALVDEATGYQAVREKRALQLKLKAFIAEDMQEWARMFPDDFWFELARLEGVRYSARSRPIRWGKYVMAFVYDAVDGDLGKELRSINPNPHYKRNHHQWLKEFGREKVNNQIQQVIAIMKLCDDMADFRAKFDRVFRKSEYQQMEFELFED